MSKRSPFYQRPVMCVVCSTWVSDTIRILDEICDDCFRKGWRPPERTEWWL